MAVIKSLTVLPILAVAIVTMVGCDSLEAIKQRFEPPPVRVVAPGQDAVLVRGQPFTVQTVIDVDYAVASVSFELWDVRTGARHTWQREITEPTQPIRIKEELETPATLPSGGDYRFSVIAMPMQTNGLHGAMGYSVLVKVAPGP